MTKPGVTIQTERILLRPFTTDDVEAYFPLVADPEVLRFTGEQPVRMLEDARQILLTRPISDYARYGFGRMACIEKSTGHLIGFCGLKFLSDQNEVDIGYRFIPSAWGKGYATESAKAVMDQIAPAHQLRRVVGFAFPENHQSIKVLVKLGLQFEGQVRLPGLDKELAKYSIQL